MLLVSLSITAGHFTKSHRSKGKDPSTCYSAAYMGRLVYSSALQSWKWQLIGMH